jgi:D-arginine dehydrogenase
MQVSKAGVVSCDFVIVGAGMAGASLAFELAHSAQVCLVEGEDRPGYHATGRSAALFAPTYGGDTIRALTRVSRVFFDTPPANFSAYPLLRQRGCLFIAREDQRARLAGMLDAIRSTGGHVTIIDRKRALDRVPLLREEYLDSALADDEAMDIDVDGLHQGYLRGARTAGARLITGSPVSQVRRTRGSWHVTLNDLVIEAPVIVNAAGAWADEFAAVCGVRRVGLQPYRRTAALVETPDHVRINRWPAVIDADEQFYFKPEAGKLLISPADETPDVPGDAHADDLDIAVGIDRVEAALAIDVKRIVRSWAGLRTFAPDRTPVVGFDPDVADFFWCAGQGGYGIQTAPGLARAAAALARREDLPTDIAAERVTAAKLSPGRFVSRPAR